MPKCRNLALKRPFDASFAEKCSTGCSGYRTDVESGPWGKVDALGVKTSVPTLETDSVFDFYYILKISN